MPGGNGKDRPERLPAGNTENGQKRINAVTAATKKAVDGNVLLAHILVSKLKTPGLPPSGLVTPLENNSLSEGSS